MSLYCSERQTCIVQKGRSKIVLLFFSPQPAKYKVIPKKGIKSNNWKEIKGVFLYINDFQLLIVIPLLGIAFANAY